MWIKLISTEQRREMIRGKFMNRSNICLSYFPLHKNAVLIMTWYWLFGTRISLHSCRWGIPVKLWSIWGASFLTWGELWAPEVRTVQFPCMDTDWAPGRANPSIFNMKNTKPCPSVCPPRFKGSPGFIAVCSQRKRSCRDHLRSSTKLHFRTVPFWKQGLVFSMYWDYSWMKRLKYWGFFGDLPKLCSWLCLITGRTIALCEFLSCSSGYCLVYTQPQNLITFIGAHFKYNHLLSGHRNT